MGGLLGGMKISFLLISSTSFLGLYALTVKLKITRHLNELIRLLISGTFSIVLGDYFISTVMVYTLFFVLISSTVNILSLKYLSTLTLETLSRPRNLVLLFKYKISPTTSPLSFSIALTFVYLLVIFFLTGLFIQTD